MGRVGVSSSTLSDCLTSAALFPTQEYLYYHTAGSLALPMNMCYNTKLLSIIITEK